MLTFSSRPYHRTNAGLGETRCRLLELPRELRDLIYGFVFDDPAPKDVELFAYKLHVPRIAITGTCHLLRAETLLLKDLAVSRFWKSHHFKITIDNNTLRGHSRLKTYRSLMRASKKVSRVAKLQHFRIERKGDGEAIDDLWLCSDRKVYGAGSLIPLDDGQRVYFRGEMIDSEDVISHDGQSLDIGGAVGYTLFGPGVPLTFLW